MSKVKTLEQRNTRYLLTWLPLVLFSGSALFFVILTGHARHMQEKQLELKQQNIWKVFTTSSLPLNIPGEYSITTSFPSDQLNRLNETSNGYTTLSKQYMHEDKLYTLTTFVTSKEYSHLLIKVFATELFIFILLFLAIIIVNRSSSRKLWQPFYTTLQSASGYDVVKNNTITLPSKTGTLEFDQLNRELNELLLKNNQAYDNQKQFVENASHEIQTPLAIIRSKLELLINEHGLTEHTALLLADITQANDRLSQLNKSLLLLAKIDNNQFPEQEKINISVLVSDILANYQEHYDNFPETDLVIADNIYLMANPALIEILFSNLVKNSVIHNYPGGYIRVRLDADQFSIENSGPPLATDPATLFERFHKGNPASKTTGLGLALVKQIAQLYGMGAAYDYGEGIHHIKLTFNTGNLPNLS
ncbi:HAMP domain-containing sensor histidine kinase [Sediminibacterium sp.]|uniref:sensor histidine kinase n=1 Tax=Sediminibacterium sp. TaxID=1917865 RepID=UPI0025D01AA1|nr:HAMP domain-containing sensor histidine kinase [Sediminibacterium sp.]MBT9485636.1 HAMP domain-containing histidine kinase [Sediminibacterium sp.]